MSIEMTILDQKERQFAKEQAKLAWDKIQEKFIGVALELEILKIIEQSIKLGMLHIKSGDLNNEQ